MSHWHFWLTLCRLDYKAGKEAAWGFKLPLDWLEDWFRLSCCSVRFLKAMSDCCRVRSRLKKILRIPWSGDCLNMEDETMRSSTAYEDSSVTQFGRRASLVFTKSTSSDEMRFDSQVLFTQLLQKLDIRKTGWWKKPRNDNITRAYPDFLSFLFQRHDNTGSFLNASSLSRLPGCIIKTVGSKLVHLCFNEIQTHIYT